MKIIDILNKIANGEQPPRKIIFREQEYEYDIGERDYYYYCNGEIYWLFDECIITNILNKEVQVLETTITYNQDNYYQYQPYTGETTIKHNITEDRILNALRPQTIFSKLDTDDEDIEKLETITKKTECGHNHHYLVNDNREYRLREVDKIILDKINELIDRYNNDRE